MNINFGIITHYDVHNHGALLQLNALKKVLEKKGISAQALQFDKNYDFMGREMKAKYEISIKSIGIYLNYLKEKGLKCFLFNYKKKKRLDKFRHQANLIGDYYTNYKNLDGIIVGSDEVFALHTGPTPAFFGYCLPSNKVFAYAGCFGPTTLSDIDKWHARAFVSSGLASMCGLSMRDQNSISIAQALTGKTPELVCDPVILYGYEEEIAHTKIMLKDPYMIVYSYDGKFEESAKEIKTYAKAHNLIIVSPGFYQKWADKNVNCDPIELLHWFKGAQCVVTNTFHGCVMSIITGREMAVKLRGNANKLFNLMREYNLKDREFGDNKPLKSVFAKKINWIEVREQIAHRRASSISYLNKMIEM